MSRGYNSALSRSDKDDQLTKAIWIGLKLLLLLLSGAFFGILFGFGMMCGLEPDSVVLDSIRNYLPF